MLVLTRKVGEALRIGSQVRVTVLDQVGKQVRIGIEAPREVVVVREELYERIAEANRLAAMGGEPNPAPEVETETPAETGAGGGQEA